MELVYDIDTGWPRQLDERMRRRIGAYTRNVNAYKIGITNSPETRIRYYESEGGFDKMIVLYETDSWNNAKNLERLLIKNNWYDDRMMNEVGGGGGRHGEGPYYLYIVL